MSVAISGTSVRVAANGLSHHILAYGRESDPTVIMLPGITSPAATADFIARPVAELGFRVFVPDLRGRGETDVAPSGGYRMDDYAADVAGLVAAMGLERPAVVGHSLGARIAAAYAVRHAGEPHGLLVLVDPPTSGPGRGPYPTSREAFLAQLDEARRGTTAADVRRFYPRWPERELTLRAEVLATCDETAVLETHAAFESEDFFPDWARVTRPALLIRGADSPVVPAAAAADLAAANPSVPIIAVPAAGHMVPWDNYPDFMRVLTRVLLQNRAA